MMHTYTCPIGDPYTRQRIADLLTAHSFDPAFAYSVEADLDKDMLRTVTLHVVGGGHETWLRTTPLRSIQ